jgi:hypothetical protein
MLFRVRLVGVVFVVQFVVEADRRILVVNFDGVDVRVGEQETQGEGKNGSSRTGGNSICIIPTGT